MNIKARLVLRNGDYYLEISSGLPKISNTEEVRQFLLHYADMIVGSSFVKTQPEGEVLAYINENNEIIIRLPSLLEDLFAPTSRYITVVEYAEKYGKKRNLIARFCRTGRIPGAFQKGHCWFIPEDAPYPRHGHFKDE